MYEQSDRSEKTVIIRMGEWREGHEGQVLETRNLGPCLGIAIYEPHTKTGFLLHEPLPQDAGGVYERFEDRLRQVFAGRPDSFEAMRAWLAGGSTLLAIHHSDEAAAFVAENRQFAEEAMQDIGIPAESVQVSWTPEGYLKASMRLYCSTGTCEVENQ